MKKFEEIIKRPRHPLFIWSDEGWLIKILWI